MKTTRKILTFVAALCALPTGLLHAQSSQVARFTTPFPFYVCDREMPAGSYMVREQYLGGHVLLIENIDQPDSAYVLYNPTQSARPASQGWARFHQYGDAKYLSSLMPAGEEAGMEILPGKAEKRALSQERANASSQETANASTISIALQPVVSGI